MGNPSIVRNLRLKCCVDTVHVAPLSLVGAGRRSHPPVASATGQSGYSVWAVAGSRGST
jgi:hypothetical protein